MDEHESAAARRVGAELDRETPAAPIGLADSRPASATPSALPAGRRVQRQLPVKPSRSLAVDPEVEAEVLRQ